MESADKSTDLRVRTGKPSDVHAVMKLALAACDENALLPQDNLSLLQEIWTCLNLHHGIIGVIDGINGLEGAAMARVENMWYSGVENQVLNERAIYVHPDFRAAKGGRARRLCQWIKHVREELDIPLLVGVISNQRTEAKLRLYEREFGKPVGFYFLVGAKTGMDSP